jgi:hypothetical protein
VCARVQGAVRNVFDQLADPGLLDTPRINVKDLPQVFVCARVSKELEATKQKSKRLNPQNTNRCREKKKLAN